MTLCLLFLERYSCSGEGGGRSTHPRKGCRTSTSVQLARRSREIFSRYMRRCRSLTRRVKSSPGVHATRECPLRSSLSDRVGARVGVPFTLHTRWALGSHPGPREGAVGPAQRRRVRVCVWRRRLAHGVLRRRAARDPLVPAEGRKWGPCGSVERVHTRHAVAGGTTGPRAAAGGARRVCGGRVGEPRRRSTRPRGGRGGPHGTPRGARSFE
jgi:hypothetical protein